MFDYTKAKNNIQAPTKIENVSRRSFLKQLGIGTGAFVLATVMPGFSTILHASPSRGDSANTKAEHALNFFVAINPDGSTSIVCHRCEMGQGIRTSIPQIIADEMEADWQQVFVVQGKADKRYGAQGTAGSTSIRNQFIDMRRIGAAARQMLEQAAADVWGVDRSQVTADHHKVKHLGNGKTLGFGELAAAAAAITAPDQKSVKLKTPDQFKLIGKEVKLFDQDDIIAGQATYAQDIQLPGMLIASIERPPVVGSTIKSFDASRALKIKGVVDVIQLKDRPLPVNVLPVSGVAVLATNTWAAHEGRKALEIEWQISEHKSHNTDSYLSELVEKVKQPGEAARKKGDVYAHDYDPAQTLEAVYTMPYQHHQPMETPAATAWVQGSGDDLKCVIWAGVQNPQWAQGLVASELGLSNEQTDKIEFNITLMGGAFGRKSKADFVLEAVELSNKVKKPVKVVWTREDDIKHGYYHSISANYMKAEMTPEKRADYWIQRVAYPPIGWTFNDKNNRPNHRDLSVGFGDTPFDLNHLSMETQTAEGHVRIGWLRAVACLNNGFALGSFVDELANKANIPAQDMWHNLLGADRHVDPKADGFDYTNYGMGYDTHPIDTKRIKRCLDTVCEKANTKQTLPEGQGWGVAVFRSFGTYVSAATKVKVENNTLEVLEMHTAIDCGVAVTPDRVKAQMEGAMVFGLTIGLMGGISVKDGQVVESNFHDSLVTRIHQVPPMFAHIIESNEPPGGVGEPGIPPVIPSITNAIFHACGKRIRDLPVNKHLNVV